MDALARIGMMATCVVAIYVGARTLLIWRRTRMVQELCIGTNLLSIAAGGLILTVLGALGGASERTPPMVPYALGLLGLVVHVAALYAGIWKIFRPQDRWPLLLATVATLLACVWMVSALLLAGTSEALAARSILLLTVRGVGMTWAAYECFRYSAMLRKRAAIGLGDSMIAHRIWLWGFGAVTVMVTIVLEFVSWGQSGAPLASTPIGLHAMSLLGFVGTCSIGCAFFPPAVYVRLVEGRFAARNAVA